MWFGTVSHSVVRNLRLTMDSEPLQKSVAELRFEPIVTMARTQGLTRAPASDTTLKGPPNIKRNKIAKRKLLLVKIF